MIAPRHFRVFLSSPGDVAEERALARKIIKDELPYEPFLRGKVTLEVVSWDDPASPVPMLASLTPQQAVDRGLPMPSACDFVVVILWSRLGTPLPDNFRKPNGGRYLSGTEWEYEDAMAGKPPPEILIYRRTDKVLLDADDLGYADKLEQRKRVHKFFERFRSSDGSHTGGVNQYDKPPSFAEDLKNHLRKLLEAKLQPTITPEKEIPDFRTFGFYESAPYDRFVGRKNDVESIVRMLRANDSAPIVTIKAMGGMGKTALAHAVVEECQQQGVFDTYIWVSTQTERFVEERRMQIGVSDLEFEGLLTRIALGLGRKDIAQSDDVDTKTAAIRDVLRLRRTLIVLDNLETVPERDRLVDRLYQIIGIGKILVTCRYRIVHNRISVHELPGLLGADGVEFLQMQIRQRKPVDTIELDTAELEAIVKETGGSPLTMSVIAGQLQYHRSIDDILMNLRSVRAPDDVLYEEMYKYMFRASLLLLSETGQDVLISMAHLVPMIGADEADIVALNGELEPTAVRELLKQLYNLSLIMLQRSARRGPRYALHPLAHNVLHSDLAYVIEE